MTTNVENLLSAVVRLLEHQDLTPSHVYFEEGTGEIHFKDIPTSNWYKITAEWFQR